MKNELSVHARNFDYPIDIKHMHTEKLCSNVKQRCLCLHNNHKKWQLYKFKQQIYLEFPHLSQIMETVNLIEIYLKTYCFSQYFFWFFYFDGTSHYTFLRDFFLLLEFCGLISVSSFCLDYFCSSLFQYSSGWRLLELFPIRAKVISFVWLIVE